ncbi:MAG TPA: M20/M25/M40 family metallo-hydrolase, partial [Bryobacteraceae bacterium]|nr:M20/M25/M40 family metallo-hydrolase [Bryobacteraceae bacterium]
YFVGYGLVVPEHKYSDFEGLDLKGKIIVAINGTPASLPGPLVSHYRTGRAAAPYLTNAGVAGAIGVANPRFMDVPWERSKLARVMPSMGLADRSMQDGAKLQISLSLNPASLDKLLEGSGHTTEELMALASAGKPLPKFPLKGTLRSKVAVRTAEAEAPNVIGVMPGADPKLKDEYVVLLAHLDHVGVGAPINGDNIYNGAFDNASGVATLIETARTMRGRKLARSVLFVAVCGEEKGLLGSRYFAERPTVTGGTLVAALNLDMFLPLHALDRLVVFGLDESTLAAPIQTVAKEFQVAVERDPEPNRNLFIRSDQYSFIRQGVPSLAFKFGYKPNSPEEKLHKDWLRNRYHAPSDDLQQPVDREAAAKFNQVMAALLERVANAPERPEWTDTSFFRRFAK